MTPGKECDDRTSRCKEYSTKVVIVCSIIGIVSVQGNEGDWNKLRWLEMRSRRLARRELRLW